MELFVIVLVVGFLPMRALGVELLVLGVELADPGREDVRLGVPLGERGEKLRLGEYRGVKQGALNDSSSCCSAIRAAALSTAQTVASTATRGSCRGVITNAMCEGFTTHNMECTLSTHDESRQTWTPFGGKMKLSIRHPAQNEGLALRLDAASSAHCSTMVRDSRKSMIAACRGRSACEAAASREGSSVRNT